MDEVSLHEMAGKKPSPQLANASSERLANHRAENVGRGLERVGGEEESQNSLLQAEREKRRFSSSRRNLEVNTTGPL